MAKLVKYFVSGTPANGSNFVEFNLDYAAAGVTLDGTQVVYSGTSGVENVWLRNRGLSFDFTFSSGGVDRLYLSGNLADYTITKSFSTVILTDKLTSAVIKVNGGTATAFDQVVFADGMVSSKALLDSVGKVAPTLDVSTRTPDDAQTLYTSLGAQSAGTVVKAFGNNDGNTFATVPMKNAALVVTGGSGIDVVYVKPYSNVDAASLSGSVDRIYLTGKMSDYAGSRSFSNFTLTRSANAGANVETVKLSGGAVNAYDWVIFADGHVKSVDLFNAIKNNTAWPTPVTTDFTANDDGVTAQPGSGVTPGLKDIQNISVINDLRQSGYYQPNETITLAVDFKDPVTVVGVPTLKLIVGATEKQADYASSANGGRRLLFTYVVQPSDVDSDGIGVVDGATAFVLGAGASMQYANSSSVNFDHDKLTAMLRAKISAFVPNAPTISRVTDDVGAVTTLTDGALTNDATPTVRVSLASTGAHVNDAIQLYDLGTPLGSATVLTQNDLNNQYVDITTGLLSNGPHEVRAMVVANGTPSDMSVVRTFTVDVQAPSAPVLKGLLADTGRSTVDGVTQDGTVSIGGLEVGARWEYSTDAGEHWNAGNAGNPATSTVGSFVLSVGTHSATDIAVRQTDAAGNVSATDYLLNPAYRLQRLQGMPGVYADVDSKIVSMSDGGHVLVWRGATDTQDNDIFVQRFDASNKATGLLQRFQGGAGNDQSPQIAALTDGGYVVVWQGQTTDGQGYDVFAQRMTSENVLVGAPLRWRGMSGPLDDMDVQVTALKNGAYALVWQGATNDGQSTDVFVQTVDASNALVGTAQRLHGTSGGFADDQPQITVLTDGGFVVVWRTYKGFGSYDRDLAVQHFDSHGAAQGALYRLGDLDSFSEDDFPQLVALPDGGYVVTWQGYVNNFGSNIKVQRFDARGDVLGPLFNWRGDELGSYLNDLKPQICALTDGGYVVVWYGATADDQQRDVFVQRVGADHVLKGGVERLHGSAGGDDVEVQVAALVGGGYVVVWQGDTLNQGADIFVQQFGSTNQKAGSVQQLHGVAGLYDDLIPHVCAMADGGFTVTWQGRVDGQSDEIFTQRFGEMGTTPTAITVDTAAEAATVSGLRGFDQVVTTSIGAARNIAGLALDVVGVSEKFARVTLSIGGESKTVDADGSGQWHYALTQDDLDHVGVGDETITVTNTVDLAGNQTSTQTALDVVFRTTAHTANNREDGYAKGTYVDSLIEGGGGWSGKEISYSFNPNGYAPWTDSEKSSFKAALQAYANVCNLKFTELSYDANIENQTNWVLTKRDTAYWSASTGTVLGSFEFPTYQWEEWGAFAGDFNAEFRSWNDLSPGGLGFNVLVHELGHALDLAHPFHGTPTFPGVDFSASDSYGTYGLNDSVWTVMSYSNGWQYANMTQAWGSSTPTMAYGTTKTPMLFDIAALQTLYGVNTSYMAGDDTYVLPTSEVAGTGWSCLWDAGGRDTISNAGSALACVINLNAYPLTAGVESQAYVSRVLKSENVNLCGGFTIADGAVVENAIGGNGADVLTGNAIANALTGNGGADQFVFNASLGVGNVDTISDFNLSQADKLVLSKSVFKSFGSSATVSAAQFRSGPAVTQAADTNDYLIYNSSNGALYYDADGSSGAYLPIQFASLTGAPQLNANCFVLAA